MTKTTLYRCIVCGSETEWDDALGDSPLCVACWDARADIDIDDELAAKRKAYREEHKDELAAKKKAYREEHKDELAAKGKAYREEHKDELAAKRKAYYEEHKDELVAKGKAYREEHKDELAAKGKAYYEEHKDELAAKGTTLMSLALSHFGEFDYKHVPSSWESTVNRLEHLAFLAKDIPLVIDDLPPKHDAMSHRQQHKDELAAKKFLLLLPAATTNNKFTPLNYLERFPALVIGFIKLFGTERARKLWKAHPSSWNTFKKKHGLFIDAKFARHVK